MFDFVKPSWSERRVSGSGWQAGLDEAGWGARKLSTTCAQNMGVGAIAQASGRPGRSRKPLGSGHS
jgi:hypothetical protein